MKRNAIGLLLAAVLICSTAMPALAAQANVTAAQAKAAAQGYVPKDSTHLRTEDDGAWYEVKFYSKDRQERYDLDVAKSTGKVISFDSEADNDKGSTSVTLTEADAKKAVTNEITGTSALSAYVKWDDGFAEYIVSFTASGCYGEYKVHPESGRVLERDITIGARPSTMTQGGAAVGTEFITAEKAAALAREQVPGAVVTDIEFKYKQDSVVYEVEAYKDYVEYEFVFNARTGALLYSRQERDDDRPISNNQQAPGGQAPGQQTSGQSEYIGVERAKQIALGSAASGAYVKDIEFDYDDGVPVYEGELRNGRWECDFKIHAVSGAILEWDVDYDD